MKIQETTGRTFKQIFQKKEPWPRHPCPEVDNCLVCRFSDKPGACRKVGAGYGLVCLGCKEGGIVTEYIGETGRNCFSRSLEHQRLFTSKHRDSAIWRHCVTDHSGISQPFQMEVRGTHTTPLERQAQEGVKIKNFAGDNLLNTKAEWRGPKITRGFFTMDILPD